jgi:putative spermidine/putrescine transport system permease protein
MLDTVALKKDLKRSEKKLKIRAFLLVLPLLVFVCFTFLTPVFSLMFQSVENSEIPTLLPNTVQEIADWSGQEAPSEAVFAALITDLTAAKKQNQIGKLARRINYNLSGARSALKKVARRLDQLTPPYKEKVIKLNKKWGDVKIWRIIQRENSVITSSYYVAAMDMQYNIKTDDVEFKSEDERIYLSLFVKTLLISLAVTLLCLMLGYPVAYLLAELPLKYSNLLMILVLLPFWSSLLVRTTSWIVILQSQGVLNDLFIFFGITEEGDRIRMAYNMTGTIIAMTHILLPFTILPLYSVMKGIPKSYMQAASSLGGRWLYSFVRVYMPQTVPGISAGALLVFILSIGYYITPALIGGQSGQLISNLIAYHIQQSLNWGLGAALSTLLLASILLLYWVYNKMVGIDKLKF